VVLASHVLERVRPSEVRETVLVAVAAEEDSIAKLAIVAGQQANVTFIPVVLHVPWLLCRNRAVQLLLQGERSRRVSTKRSEVAQQIRKARSVSHCCMASSLQLLLGGLCLDI
jgi:hypothetical protein